MGQENSVAVVCSGGLDNSKNPHQLFQFPGSAIILENFEPALSGGYRRINGYWPFGLSVGESENIYGQGVYGSTVYAVPPPVADASLGLAYYATGIVSCADKYVHFSTDGITWEEVDDARTDAGRYEMVVYEGDSSNYTYGTLYMADGNNNIGKLQITAPAVPTYTYSTIDPTTTGAPAAPSILAIYKDRLVASGDSSAPNVVYWSGRFELDDFSTASAGYIELTDIVVGMKSFRERLFIFCKNSIYVLSNIDDAQQLSIQPITTNLGCICGKSIQEIGGDLVFLSHDGIRSLSATERIGDISLSTISTPIQSLMQEIRLAVAANCLSSVVIRNKNQYRLFYPESGRSTSLQKGVVGTLVSGETGIRWEWSRLKGIEAVSVVSAIDSGRTERVFHADYSGNVFVHDVGNTFYGKMIEAIYRTPYMNFQDSSFFKTIHYLRLPLAVEGSVPADAISVTTRYDFEDSNTAQPSPVYIGNYNTESVYGSATYGTNVYGARPVWDDKVLQEGSGHTISWTFTTVKTSQSFTINGFTIVFTAGKRL